jgi:hypothetical protein
MSRLPILLLLAISLAGVPSALAQLTIGNGHHVLEIGGSVSGYYNHRFLKPGEEDRKKDRFRLRDAQLQLEGRYRNLIEYEVQIDFADIAMAGSGAIDPENPGLLDAYIRYKPVSHFDITVGYAKLPYGRSSQTPFVYSPYWQRAELLRGDLFSRRDVGLTLSTSLWKQRITAYAGIYTGMGEISLRGDNDASGAPEFIGRLEVAYPSRYRYRDIDTRHTPIPMFVVGVNGRYTDRTLPAGTTLPAFAGGEYGIKNIDGRKYTYGFDVSAQYMGLSAQFEMHQLRLEPTSPNSVLFQGIPAADHNGYVLAGGYVAHLNYHVKPANLTVSVRFDEMNLNDLAPGVSRRGSVALAYHANRFNTMVKAQYFHVFEEESSIDPLRWGEQFRIGFVYTFK